MITRLCIALLFACGSLAAQPHNVRIGVLGLFEPSHLTLRASHAGPLRLSTGQPIEGQHAAQLTASNDRLLVEINGRTMETERLTAEGSFELTVPGKLTRQYSGALEVTARTGKLQTVVSMDLETAVAAALAGEADLDGPRQALLAQAVASRSYIASGPRHPSFDFCDTTHCQYLTDGNDPRARSAAAETAGMVLWSQGHIFEALFTRSCSGRTLTPQDVGLTDGTASQGAVCPICTREPLAWSRTHALTDVAALLHDHSEQARLAVVRRLGWDAIPSNTYRVVVKGDQATFTGAGEGHGIGLCQRGAGGLARQGAGWREILQRYYPLAVAERH